MTQADIYRVSNVPSLSFSRTLWAAQSHFLPPSLVADEIDRSNGRLFEITFLKRGDNEPRTMRCRTGVTKWVREARAAKYAKLKEQYTALLCEPYESEQRNIANTRERHVILSQMRELESGVDRSPYEPREHGLIRVADMDKLGYRMISTESVTRLRIGGHIYTPARDGMWGFKVEPAPKRRHVRTRPASN